MSAAAVTLAKTTTALAESTLSRAGTAVSVGWMVPLAYSPVMTSTPSTPAMS